ncbi:MAG: MopE-related protein, partial [Desulfotignum sp.]|nr:MopE-related protein [Desulfotignum sp.]
TTKPFFLNVDFAVEPDVDNDGYTVEQGDCNDNDSNIYPGAPELCDGKDNDCNPATADGSGESWYGTACDGPDTDLCKEGILTCSGGQQICTDNTGNNIEICDGLDNDCNPATADGSGESWYGTACDGPDTDLCKEGILTCSGGQQICTDNTGNNIEFCDGVDNDCNPATADGSGESWYGTATNCGTGECERVGHLACSGGIQTDTCVPGQSSEEVCDDKDNDCDGLVDEDGVCDNTPAGQDVHVEDEWHQASVTFDSVLQGGDTIFATGPCGGSAWEGFTLIPADNPTCVEIETTAEFAGSVKVCINYDDTGLTLDQEQKLVMIHCNDQGKCSMIPCDPPIPVDTVNNVVCGCTETFSIFGVGFWEGCNADLDYDGVVDGKDLSDFVNAYGTASGHSAFIPHADFDGSGTIDAGDIPAMGRGLGADNCPIP